MSNYTVIGASVAGLSAIDVLRQQDKTSEIILISDETKIYSKCLMHSFLAGEYTEEALSFVSSDFIEKNNVTWEKGKKAVGIDVDRKNISLSDGSGVDYDKLLIATGAKASFPPVEGLNEAGNVCVFHSLADCKKIMSLADKAQNIVILGAGLVGVDVAFGLAMLHKKATMIDIKDHMLAIQLDANAAKTYEDEFTKRGIVQIYNKGIDGTIQNAEGNIEQIFLTDGSKLPCDLLILATGARANVGWLEGSGLEIDTSGLVIDERCRTNCRDVYGAGDVTGRDLIWPAAAKEGRTAAFNMAGRDSVMTDFFEKKATINIFDIPTMTFGAPDPPDDTYEVELRKGTGNAYQKLIYKEGRLFGAILQQDMYYAGVLNQIRHRNLDLSKIGKPILDLDYNDLLVL